MKTGKWKYREENFTCPKCGVLYKKSFHGKDFGGYWDKNIYMHANKCCGSYYLIDGEDVTSQIEKGGIF